jgi:1,2-diacylglycerol 3-beta-glucosyltransferase
VSCRSRRRASTDGLAGIAALAVLAPTPLVAYLGVLTGAAWWTARGPGGAPPRGAPTTRFAVLVPAHDEERLVADTVRSLLAVDYPADLRHVHVVADHCGDRTADVVRACGVESHAHDDPEPAGKGPALQWLLRRLLARGDRFDAVVVVDADSVVNTAFLSAFDAELASGADAVQGRYTVRDPSASPATALRTAALDLRHHVRPLGRNALGASCGLYGNGMAFRTDVLLDRPWTGHLTEDLELQIRLVLDGVAVRYAPGAVVAAEMPEALADATSQNERWERGRVDLARRGVPRLLRAALGSPARSRVAIADTALDLLVPPLSVLAAAAVASASSTLTLRALCPTRITRVSAVVGTASVVALGAHVLVGLRVAGAPRSAYAALVRAPAAMAWKVRLWTRMAGGRSDVSWQRTARNRGRRAA